MYERKYSHLWYGRLGLIDVGIIFEDYKNRLEVIFCGRKVLLYLLKKNLQI